MAKEKIKLNKAEDYMGVNKFKDIDRDFHDSINKILDLGIPKIDLIHQFPIFIGHVNLARYLFFYDMYKKVQGLAGDVADIGTWKGSTFLFMAKVIKLFEPYTYTQVHGFDWFKGMKPGKGDNSDYAGKYDSSYNNLLRLIELQGLGDMAVLHKLDLQKDLGKFFKDNPHLRFKMVFVDCGITKVLEECLKYYWPRLVPGGILIMDHYGLDCSPNESRIVDKYVGNNHIEHAIFTRQPSAYVIKKQV